MFMYVSWKTNKAIMYVEKSRGYIMDITHYKQYNVYSTYMVSNMYMQTIKTKIMKMSHLYHMLSIKG